MVEFASSNLQFYPAKGFRLDLLELLRQVKYLSLSFLGGEYPI